MASYSELEAMVHAELDRAPVVEVIEPDGRHIKVFWDGRVEGAGKHVIVINRMQPLMLYIVAFVKESLKLKPHA